MKALPGKEKPPIFSIKSAAGAMNTGASSYVIHSKSKTPPSQWMTEINGGFAISGSLGAFSWAVLTEQNHSALPSGIVNPQRLAGIRPEPASKQLLKIAGFAAIFNIANY